MLSSLWQNVVGEPSKSQIYDAEEEFSNVNDDELADKLLTQFPGYGSAEAATVEWLADGDDDHDDHLQAGSQVLVDDTALLTATGNGETPNHAPASAAAAKAMASSTRDWDQEEQGLWKGSDANHGEPIQYKKSTPTTLAGVTFYSSPPQEQDEQDDRQHWMPDKLCKQCYACELPFTGKRETLSFHHTTAA